MSRPLTTEVINSIHVRLQRVGPYDDPDHYLVQVLQAESGASYVERKFNSVNFAFSFYSELDRKIRSMVTRGSAT